MEKKPKTKEVVRTIKEHTASAAKDKAIQIGVRTKDAVKTKTEEQFSQQQNRKQEQSAESYASDQVTEVGQKATEDAVIIGKSAAKTTFRKVKEKRSESNAVEEQAEAASGETETCDGKMPEPESVTETSVDNTEFSSGDNPTSIQEQPKDSKTAKTREVTANPDTSPTDSVNADSSKKPRQTTADTMPNGQTGAESKKGEAVSRSASADPLPSDAPSESDNTEKPKGKTAEQSGKTSQKKQKNHTVSSKTPSDETETIAKKRTAKKSEQEATGENVTVKKSVAQDNASISASENKTIPRKTPEQTAIKERTHSTPKNAFASDSLERDVKPRTKQKSLPKQRGQQTIKHAGTRANEFRTAASTSHKVKEVQRGTTQTIKTADKTVKNAERTAKATKKAAETTAKAAKRSEEAARRTAKTAIQATKVAVKAAIEGIKAAIAAGKELIAAIGAGGPVVLVIIIVICLIAAVGGTCFGIFLSNDKTTGTKITMPEAISQLTAEHYSDLTDLKSKYTYDTMEVEGGASMAINWKDVLAVYAVKTTTSTENAYEVVTMDDVKMNLLRDVISDMNKITCVVVPTVVSETVTETDTSGKTVTTTKYVTKNILKVTVIRLTVDQIVEQYHFNEEQKKQLTELMSSDYDDLWQNIISTTGDVLITSSTYIPTDIFAWPLQSNGNITSGYGYRHDPKTGEWKLHGGTDIAAPTGTPILASADGVVIAATWHNSYGYYVKIQHNDTFATLYGHCSALHVTAGQQVKQGQIIADVGQTGYATGPHVHFEVYINGTRVDAMQYFK